MALWQVIGLIILTVISAAIGSGNNAPAAVFTFVFFVSALVLYFAPTITASKKDHPNKNSIIALNVLLGWTVLGWVVSLVWSYSEKQKVIAEVAMPAAAVPKLAPQADPAVAMKKCPFCAEDVRAEAIKCKHCGSDLTASTA